MRRWGAILVALVLTAVAVAQPVALPRAVNGVVVGGGPPNVPPPLIAPPPPSKPFPIHLFTPWWIVIVVVIVQQQRKTQEEEEEVSATIDGPEVEYKIIRNSFGAFKDPIKFRAALAEEARCGWQLVEKFDDNRVRLRRPVSCRATDAESGQDPYRTRVGGGGGAVAAVVIVAVVVVVGALALLLALTVK